MPRFAVNVTITVEARDSVQAASDIAFLLEDSGTFEAGSWMVMQSRLTGRQKEVPHFFIPDDAWEPSGDNAADDERARLLAHVVINGANHHAEAIAVTLVRSGATQDEDDEDEDDIGPHIQEAAQSDDPGADIFTETYNAVGGDGAWATTEIDGRDYVIIITPFCD